MTQIDPSKRYEIGRLRMNGLDSPETSEYLYVPAVFSGDRLIEFGITTWEDFFKSAPPQFHIGKLYHVFIPGRESRKYVTHGTVTGIVTKYNGGMSDQVKDIMTLTKNTDSPAQTRLLRDQIQEKDQEIKRLQQKVDELTKELFQAKESKIFAEQELRRTIGLNDAIQQKETEYMKAIEKAQKDQAESSNKILEGIFALASTGMQLWLNSTSQKNGSAPAPQQMPMMQQPKPTLKDHVNNLNEGDTVQIKNKNGENENWTIKMVGDKKVIVNDQGQMKSF